MCLCSNRAAAYLALGMWDEALKDAERARVLAQDALKKTYKAAPLFIKTFAQKGTALIGEGHPCLQPSISLWHQGLCRARLSDCRASCGTWAGR